jgi:carbon-monoxide dehydrogenase medium subunit
MPQSFHAPETVEDAIGRLAVPGAVPLAGATWTMRGPLRDEALSGPYVAVGRIPELRAIVVGDSDITIGACATHADIAAALAGVPECRGLVQAAKGAANPAIRQVATIGGNLCCVAFAAQDFIPALLALDAEVEVRTAAGSTRMPLDAFLARRPAMPQGWLLTRIVVKRRPLRAAHARLPLRKAGDYPVAIVSVAVSLDDGAHLGDVRVAVGSVEPVARRWTALEAALAGRLLDPDGAAELAAAHSGVFEGRDWVEAPGWYRVQVLPGLVRRAFEDLREAGR